MMAQRDDAGAGQGREVDHHFGLVAARIVQRVAQDQAALGVGVEDLDRLTRGAGDDVAGLDGAAVGHVLAGRDQSDQIDLELAARREVDRRQHRGGAAHVVLHLVHRRRVLQRDAAGVEGDALADQHHRCAAAARAAVFQHDEARRFVAAAGDGQKATHLQAPDPGLIEHAHPQAAPIAALELARLRCQIARRADVGRQVAQIAQQLRRSRDTAAPAASPRRTSAMRAARPPARHSTRASAGGRGRRAVFRSLMRYRLGAGDLRGCAPEIIVVQFAQRPGAPARWRPRRCAYGPGRRWRCCSARRQAAAVELRLDAQAHQQQPPGGEPGHLRQQQRLARAAGEIPTREQCAHAAAHARGPPPSPQRPARRARRRRLPGNRCADRRPCG